ncbi:MAG: TIGR04076 family protein [Armatimonadota bacterium]
MPIQVTVMDGQCSGKFHQVGQVITIGHTTPAGMCFGAWNAIAPYLTALRHGANFPWEKEEGVATIHCPDPKGITLELRRVQEAEQ